MNPSMYLKKSYVREFYVKNVNGFTDFYATQVLDDKMNLLGYSFGDSNFTSIQTNKDGIFIVRDKNSSYIGYKVDINISQFENDKEKIESKFLIKNTLPKNIIENEINSIDTLFETRIKAYLKEMGFLNKKKIVFITTDAICHNCLEFTIDYFNKNKKDLDKNKIIYLFVGMNVKFNKEILENYKLKSSNNVKIDLNRVFINYFDNDESKKNYVIENVDGEINITTFDYSNVHEVVGGLLQN